ncbi:MAG: hypothetical protein AAFS12_00605 [Cyanobacteria bacterium J06632_19]
MQRVKSKIFLWGLTPCLISGLLSCSNLSEYGMNAIGANVTSIGELKPPTTDNEAPVYIQGKVERKVPLLKQQMYQIDDSTGKVWVLTNQKTWKVGDKIVVKALPQYQSIPISGTDLGQVYLQEK